MLEFKNAEPVKPDRQIIEFYKQMREQTNEKTNYGLLESYLRYIIETQERKEEYKEELDILLELLEV